MNLGESTFIAAITPVTVCGISIAITKQLGSEAFLYLTGFYIFSLLLIIDQCRIKINRIKNRKLEEKQNSRRIAENSRRIAEEMSRLESVKKERVLGLSGYASSDSTSTAPSKTRFQIAKSDE